MSIESLKEKAYSIVGRPDDVQFKDNVVAVLEARDGTFDLFVTVALAREFLIKLCFAVLLARKDIDGSYEGRLRRFCRGCRSLPIRCALCPSRAIAARAAARARLLLIRGA